MWKVNGNNIFEENTYSWHSWSADILQDPEEVYECFNNLNIFNKKISKIKAIGLGYNLRDSYLEDELEDDSNISPKSSANYIPRIVEIDEPIIIVFEDDERLEMDFSEGSSIRISKNTIPINIKPGVNENNFDATKFFSCCIEQKIVGIEVKTKDTVEYFTGSYGMRLALQDKYIDSVWLILSNSTKIKFEAWCDYGVVTATDEHNKPLEIDLYELRKHLAEYETIPVGKRRIDLSNPASKCSTLSLVVSKLCTFLLKICSNIFKK